MDIISEHFSAAWLMIWMTDLSVTVKLLISASYVTRLNFWVLSRSTPVCTPSSNRKICVLPVTQL
jgi:hypothetical protein